MTMALDFDAARQRAAQARAGVVRGRYAPSPTGRLHLGNLRTALLAWLHARLCAGQFILRIEDLDQPRVRPGSAAQMLADLRWLGLDWDEGPDVGGPFAPYVQSQRLALYAEALKRLMARRAVFPCYCSRKDIAMAASAPHAGEHSSVYPGTCRDRSLTSAQSASGREPAWRLRAPDVHIEFVDGILGAFGQQMARDVGDFVVRRADGLYAYQLAVSVDDALMGVTHVVRGADLLDSTPRQLLLFTTLNLEPAPEYWHVPLWRDAAGERLAKRDEAHSLAVYQERAMRPAQVIGALASSLGLVPAGSALSARELAQELTVERLRAALRQNAPAP